MVRTLRGLLTPLIAICSFTGAAEAADGGTACASSGECRIPTPYCNVAGHRCVECLSDRNCPAGTVCDPASGACKACLSDADCSGETPYCDVPQGKCIECVSDTNCGDIGLKCKDGKCGSCGDGICSPKEGLFFEVAFTPSGPPVPDPRTVCELDCASYCPTKDVGSELGKFSVSGSGLRNLYSSGCDQGMDGVEATFAWKAPRSDTFLFATSGIAVSLHQGSCAAFDANCGAGFFDDGGRGGATVNMPLSEGDVVIVEIETGLMSVSSVTLEISKGAPSCGFFGCPPPPGGDAGGSEGGNDQGATVCLNNAKDRGDPLCSGVDCACHHCPRDYDDCAVVPGCGDIAACMRRENCTGTECYNSGACRRIIDSNGGVSGPAFSTSARLQSCELTFNCALPCGGSDGGATTDGSTPDGGQACEPGRTVTCPCEGGTGEKTCNDGGDGYGACSCGAPPVTEDIGCDCALASAHSTSSAGVIAALAAASVAAGRRRRRSLTKEPRP